MVPRAGAAAGEASAATPQPGQGGGKRPLGVAPGGAETGRARIRAHPLLLGRLPARHPLRAVAPGLPLGARPQVPPALRPGRIIPSEHSSACLHAALADSAPGL